MTFLVRKANMPSEMRTNLTPQLVAGACLVTFGTLLTLDRLQLVEAANSLRFWPVVLIALGVWKWMEIRSVMGPILVIAGTLLLLNNFGVVRVRLWELFWPLLLVLVGARLIMQMPNRAAEAPRQPSYDQFQNGPIATPAHTSGTVSLFTVLGGTRRASNDRPFRGGEITSILGGTQLDLRQATIEPGQEAVINVFTLMGGHELWVPSEWMVVSDVIPLLGGVDDKRLPPIDPTPRRPDAAQPRLVLRGMVVMGGLTIKS